mmetsp:Transcript_2704/g.4248  ORF Transcript_2704/g.4248 Transcript_2704/m.4248 type:complete len:168 (+) Transcript_2704:2897-3400(+)
MLMTENYGYVYLRWQHSWQALSCLTTGMDTYLLDNSWNEVALFSDKTSLTSGKLKNMFRYASYNGGWRWGGLERTGYNSYFRISLNGIKEEETSSSKFSMDEFMNTYTFDNIDHFKDSRKYPRDYHRSLAFRTNSWVGGYIDSRTKSQYLNVLKCGDLMPTNFDELT